MWLYQTLKFQPFEVSYLNRIYIYSSWLIIIPEFKKQDHRTVQHWVICDYTKHLLTR